MANPETEKSITGLDQATNRKEAEYDLVKSLLEAAEFKTADENITEVEIKRGGKFYFAVRVHPISFLFSGFGMKTVAFLRAKRISSSLMGWTRTAK